MFPRYLQMPQLTHADEGSPKNAHLRNYQITRLWILKSSISSNLWKNVPTMYTRKNSRIQRSTSKKKNVFVLRHLSPLIIDKPLWVSWGICRYLGNTPSSARQGRGAPLSCSHDRREKLSPDLSAVPDKIMNNSVNLANFEKSQKKGLRILSGIYDFFFVTVTLGHPV